jgi:hypothetical protein
VWLAVVWALASAGAQFALGWELPVAGRSLAGPMLEVAALGVLLFGVGVVATWWKSRGQAAGVLPLAVVVLLTSWLFATVGSVTWTYAAVIQLRMSIGSGELSALVHRAETSRLDSSGCLPFPHSFPAVPLLGTPDSVCVEAGTVAFLRGPARDTYGLVYVSPADAAPAANEVMPLAVSLEVKYGCVQRLNQVWWEVAWGGVSDGGVKGNGSCPLGVGDNSD